MESQLGKKKGKLIGRDVVWVKPSMWKREFHLLADGEHMASMWFEHWYNNVATVEGLGQRWTFNRKGWFQQQVVAEDDDLYKEALPFRYSWSGGGTLYLDDGSTLKFKNSVWSSKSSWQTVNGDNVITFYKQSWWRSSINVDFHPTAAAYSELPILIFLGFYLRTLRDQDAAAAAAT